MRPTPKEAETQPRLSVYRLASGKLLPSPFEEHRFIVSDRRRNLTDFRDSSNVKALV